MSVKYNSEKHRYVGIVSESLWPLTQFRLSNPCKKCLIKMRCSAACEEYAKYSSLRYNIKRRYRKFKKKVNDTTLYDCFEFFALTILYVIFTIGAIFAVVFISLCILCLLSEVVQLVIGAL